MKHTKEKKGRLVKFALNFKMSMSKEKFVLNKVNKWEFLWHLTECLNCHGIKSVQWYAYADILIATTAVEWSCNRTVSVIGKDTDLLIC